METHSTFSARPALAVVLACLISAICSAQAVPQITASDIYKRTHSSVVVVIVGDGDSKPIGQGSGFIIANDRIVTNHHVLEGAASALVIFADGSSKLAEGIAADSPARDLAILDVRTGSRPALKLGDELAVRQGDSVYALGAPRGLDLSLTNGIVSGFRDVDNQFLIQTTAPIAPGSSGGPLFDSSGRVIGVTTALLRDSPGIYFSIGAGDVKRLLHTPNPVSTPFSVWSQRNAAEAESVAKSSSEENKPNSSDGESVAAGESQVPYVTEVWKNLQDDQTYRTSSNGQVIHLESVDVYPKTAADILSCDFKRVVRAGSGWAGVCRERNQKDRSTNESSATLATFSETRIEGSTEYIHEFVMIPASDASFQSGRLVSGESPTRGGIHIVTDVMGAMAALHSATGSVLDKCQTPCSFKNLWPSPYTVEVQKDGYRPAQIALQVVAGKVWEQKIGLDEMASKDLSSNTEPLHKEKSSPTPASGYGAIHVVTDVLGATAFLHGPEGRVIYQCRTPCSFNNLPPARYSLEVQKEGYRPIQTTLQVEEGDGQEQKIKLEPMPRGIFVSSQPSGADVFINGAKQSGQTPVTLPLAPGQYNLVLRIAGYESYSGSIEVKDNIQTQLRVALNKK